MFWKSKKETPPAEKKEPIEFRFDDDMHKRRMYPPDLCLS